MKNILGRDSKNTNSEPSVENILRDGKDPLLLILDEAQALGDEDIPPSQYKAAAIQVIELIHNGELGRPIILLATGLDGARRGFSNLKVSRFARNCFVELGASSKESERAVIQDWLQKEGGAKGDPTEWTDAITQETHGWPHHILSYAYPAAEYLKSNDGIMSPEGLNVVLESGRKGRREYYKERVGDFRVDQIHCLAKSIGKCSPWRAC